VNRRIYLQDTDKENWKITKIEENRKKEKPEKENQKNLETKLEPHQV
jgi:hypothetical protein